MAAMSQGNPPPFARAAQWFSQVLILYSVVTMAMETMPELSGWTRFFTGSETVVVLVFTVEYFVRWWWAADRRRYPFSALAIIDLLAVLPFYLAVGLDLRGLRAVRLLRVFQLLKLSRYNQALQTLGEALRRTAPEFAALGTITAMVLFFAAVGVYYAENTRQPEAFASVPAALWWAVVTLTTVGYGDVYPVTPLGKCMASVVMLLGIGWIAIPAGLLSSTLTEMLRERRHRGPTPPDGAQG